MVRLSFSFPEHLIALCLNIVYLHNAPLKCIDGGDLERKDIYTLEQVFQYIGSNKPRKNKKTIVDFYGDDINVEVLRYYCFKANGVTCCSCGIKGEFFAKERFIKASPTNPKNLFFLNLYAFNEDGDEVKMTVDHIIPRSRGGRDHPWNLRPMCEICNTKRDNEIDEMAEADVKRLMAESKVKCLRHEENIKYENEVEKVVEVELTTI